MAWLNLRKKRVARVDLQKKPGHAALRDADPYAFQASHRRLGWVFRASVILNVAASAVISAQLGLIIQMFPLKQVVPMLIRADADDDRIVRVEPIGPGVDGFDLLLETQVRRFVKLLLEIDPVSVEAHFAEVVPMTGDEFYKKFKKERMDSGELDKALDSGLNRSIVVESAQRLDEYEGVMKYVVDFLQIDKRGGKLIEERPLRAYLSVTTRPREVRAEDRYVNPLGFTVLDMSLKEKSAPSARAARR